MKFLSEEWAQALTASLNENEAFRAAAGSTTAKIQQIITAESGDTHYWMTLEGGVVGMGIGDMDAPDATITQSYETAVGLATGKVNGVAAFMTGKVKVGGNMGLLLGLQPALGHLATTMAALDVEY